MPESFLFDTLRKRPAQTDRSGLRPAVYEAVRSQGRPLDASTLVTMESRLGRDFSHVRVHSDKAAENAAAELTSRAFTVGDEVVFGRGQYHPESSEGMRLLAHELAHTLQQGSGAEGGGVSVGDATGLAENEAAAAAEAVSKREPAEVGLRYPVAVQRQQLPGATDLTELASPTMAAVIGSVTIDGFVTGQAQVSESNKAKLAVTASRIVILMKKYPGSSVRVIGHTDAVGTEKDNMALGERRAESTKAVLVSLGVPAESIVTESKGESSLLVKTEKAEPRNRRADVEFEPLRMPGMPPAPQLTLPEPKKEEPAVVPPPPPSLIPRLEPWNRGEDSEKPQLPPWFWNPDLIPPLKKGQGKSLSDVYRDFATSVTRWLPEKVRGAARDAVQSALEKGTTASLDSALQAAGVDPTYRAAVVKAAEAAIKQKIQ